MTVTKEITKLENSAVKLTVTINKDDVASGYNESIAKFAKTIQIPGFRKGKVPVSVLERKYGDALKNDIAGELIEKALGQIFEEIEEKPLPYSTPSMDTLPEFDLTKDYTFTVTYDIFPVVKDVDLKGIEIEVPTCSVTEKDITEELKSIQERNATVIEKKDDEAAAKDDIATVNYAEIDDEAKVIPNTERQDFVFTIGTEQNIFKFDDDVIGMKKGETKIIVKKYPEDFADKDLAGQTKKIKVTLTTLKIRNLPALDDELAQDVNEKFKTLDDLKADIKKNLELAVENRIKELKSTALIEKLIEKNPVALPVSMINTELEYRWRALAQQFQTTVEQLDKLVTSSGRTKEDMLKEWTGDSEKNLKGRILVDSLLKAREITVSPEDVDAEYAKIAESAGISVDEVKSHYSDPRAKEYLIDDMKEQKLYAKLYEEVSVKKGKKTAFADLFKNA